MPTRRSQKSDDRGPIRVLLVEDEELDANLASRQLRAAGIVHIVRCVETDEAMRVALRDFRPTIILSDFTLPLFSGLSALSIARELAPEVPFIFVSGTIGEERAIEGLQQGAADYVLKTNLARLVPAVKRALDDIEARALRRAQESQISRLTAVLRMLSGINGAAVRIRDRGELLREACRLAVSVGGYVAAVVALKQPKPHALKPVAWSGTEEAEAKELCRYLERRGSERVPTARGTGDTTIVSMLRLEEGTTPEDTSERHGAAPPKITDRPVIGLPLTVDKTSIGVLAVSTRESGSVGDEELRMLREVAATLSFGLQYLQENTRVRLLSYFDPLTGLAKRTLFCERLGTLLGGAGKTGSRYAVVVVDIQNLSAVNDAFGRHAGDLLLQLLADRLKRRFQDTESLAHLGGGTFLLVQAVSPPLQGWLEALSADLNGLFDEPFALDGIDLVPIAARSGVALYPDDARNADGLIQNAESALRTAKLAGARHGHYSAHQHSARLARVALERKLRVALEHQQFALHYQPKVDVRTSRIVGVEALIRWNEPERGLVSPAEFLPILEESGLIVEVGDWIAGRAAADCQHWVRLGLPPVRVAVNISPVQLNLSNFVERFLTHTEPWANAQCGLDIEITESTLIDDSSPEIGRLKMLRAAGVRVAIDDFGTGYSSLRRLAHLPIDVLKIDRTFINGMLEDDQGKRLVSIIIEIARAFKMPVVAEGVETQAQFDTLHQLGCDQSQGYLHSKPVTREQFAELLRHGRGPCILPKEPE